MKLLSVNNKDLFKSIHMRSCGGIGKNQSWKIVTDDQGTTYYKCTHCDAKYERNPLGFTGTIPFTARNFEICMDIIKAELNANILSELVVGKSGAVLQSTPINYLNHLNEDMIPCL